jgi:hypothetical protein
MTNRREHILPCAGFHFYHVGYRSLWDYFICLRMISINSNVVFIIVLVSFCFQSIRMVVFLPEQANIFSILLFGLAWQYDWTPFYWTTRRRAETKARIMKTIRPMVFNGLLNASFHAAITFRIRFRWSRYALARYHPHLRTKLGPIRFFVITWKPKSEDRLDWYC